MKVRIISPKYVKHFPEQLEEGVLYISEEFKLTAHKCCCGCGEDVYNKLSPVKWNLTKSSDGSVSLYPSIGNWKYPCQSHYWISKNRVIDAGPMSDQEIEEVQKQDRKDRDMYIAQINDHYNRKLSIKIWRFSHLIVRRAFQFIKDLWRL